MLVEGFECTKQLILVVARFETGIRGIERARTSEARTSNEVLVIEIAVGAFREDVEILGKGNQDAEEEGKVCAINAKWRSVGQGFGRHFLRFAGADEVDVRDEDGDPLRCCISITAIF